MKGYRKIRIKKKKYSPERRKKYSLKEKIFITLLFIASFITLSNIIYSIFRANTNTVINSNKKRAIYKLNETELNLSKNVDNDDIKNESYNSQDNNDPSLNNENR